MAGLLALALLAAAFVAISYRAAVREAKRHKEKHTMKLTVTGTVEELADFGEDMRRLIADKRRQATVGSPAVVALIHTNFIGAIKQYREETGVGLKDAKDACEAIRARIGGNK